MDVKKEKRISKFLSLILRHKPEIIGIDLDPSGWADVQELLQKLNKRDMQIDFETLEYVVANNSKKRFTFNPDKTKIRANQGHSVAISHDFEEVTPPVILYHGTALRFIDSILTTGIEKRSRHHVHLSPDQATAKKVGQRHGKPVVLKINSLAMYRSGHAFYLSENNIWLTDFVPPEFIIQNT
jgi:putative RNA 2'-phosphotransferase